jgi:hypothetical protein
MPETVAEIEHAATVVAIQRLSELVEIGDVDHSVLQAVLVVLRDIAALRVLDPAEIFRECHLLIVADALVAKYEYCVAVHTGFDCRHVLFRYRRAQIHTGHFARELGAYWMNGYRHVSSPSVQQTIIGSTRR